MPPNFDQFAEEAGLAKPMVRRRVLEVVEKILSALPALERVDNTTEAIARLIRERCDHVQRLLRG
jgi:uncharacterized protein YjaG (DUF416 family)